MLNERKIRGNKGEIKEGGAVGGIKNRKQKEKERNNSQKSPHSGSNTRLQHGSILCTEALSPLTGCMVSCGSFGLPILGLR